MKKNLVITIAFLLVVTSLAIAGSYTINTTTAQDTRLERHRNRLNKFACTSAGLSVGCTQAQCRAANPTCDIYSDVADMIDRNILRGYLTGLANVDTSDDKDQFCSWWKAATAVQKNTVCSAAGLPNGCEVCQQL